MTTSRRQRWDAARNRTQVLDAARESFAERGLATDVREIARRAGVGVATLYRHFPTKDDLVKAVLEDDVAEWTAVSERAKAAEDAWEGIGLFVERTLAMMARHRAFLDGLTVTEGALDACRAHLAESLDDLVERAHAQGRLRAGITSADIGLQILALGRIVELTSAQGDDVWRKHAGLVLSALEA
ncbi:TetR/AcrR family transcriptional regulator [Amycolatopsis sp. lyj-112]|uniref:TetR/AcrR family transcriptional regulator n=1 Tax=Amycolatopsis sp. lyj-112 TaxID=2789288 RepID=UPI00397D7AE4